MNASDPATATPSKDSGLRARVLALLSSPQHITVLLIAASAISFWLQAGVGLNNDTKVQLHYAMLLLKEGGMYERWIDVNPPMIFLLYLPPAWLITEHILNPKLALNLYTLALCFFSIVATWQALKPLESRERLGWTSLCAFALLAVPTVFFVFGDREHLLFIFAFPWMMQMLLGMEPRIWSVVMAAPGIFLKPYNLLICGALLLFGGPKKTLMARVFSRSSMVFLALGICYAAAIFIWFPRYPLAIIPMLLVVYREIAKPLSLQSWQMQPFVAIGGIMLMLGRFRNTFPRFAIEAMLLACFTVYFLNGGWLYTLYLLAVPCLILSFMPLMSSSGDGNNAVRKHEAARAFGGGILVAAMLVCSVSLNADYYFTGSGVYGRAYTDVPPEFNARFRTAAGEDFILLSPTIWASNTADLGEAPHQLYAYDSMWMLPWLYTHQDSPNRQQIQDAVALPLISALASHPRVIVDESRRQRNLPENISIMRFLKQDPRIAAAFEGYARVDEINVCSKKWYAACRFGIWVWQPAGGNKDAE